MIQIEKKFWLKLVPTDKIELVKKIYIQPLLSEKPLRTKICRLILRKIFADFASKKSL
ncbi:hypothetical protein ACFP3I_01800 [Chryseobacterium arachidis]|uniref:hypothetical protein n=1 Tax=Chryseobacterium arachidis TaxID=1416778 RepID=UPI00361EC134